MLRVPIVIEVSAVVFGALSGALHAANRKTDIVGMFALGMATGAGGGILRDLLIGVSPPVALSRSSYLPVVAAAALLAMLFASWLSQFARVLMIVDALLLGLWTLVGTEQALAHHLPVVSGIFVGTITAVGGSAVRDLLSRETPIVFMPGELYATAAFAGALIYVALVSWAGMPVWAGEVAAVGISFTARLAAVRWHVHAPGPIDLPARWRSRERGAPSPHDR